MKIEITGCFLALALLPACSITSQTTAGHQTLEQRLTAKYASADTATTQDEPAPPAEGPHDVPPDVPGNVNRNLALVPTPVLRYSAASATP